MPLVSELQEYYPSNCPTLLAVRAKHSDWSWCLNGGYIQYNSGQTSLYEHRLVAERIAGRKLPSHIHTHHIDEQKAHNDADNLEIMHRADHNRHHKLGTGNTEICDGCGREFHVIPFKRKNNKYIFCSRKCYRKNIVKYASKNGGSGWPKGKMRKRPPMNEFWRIYEECNFVKSEMARRLDVHVVTVFKWFRELRTE